MALVPRFSVQRAERINTLGTVTNLKLPNINLPGDQIVNIQPAGDIGYDVPTSSVWVSNGLQWLPIGGSPGVRDSMTVGVSYGTMQSIASGSPVVVQLSTDYSSTLSIPAAASFQLDPINYGVKILADGVYRLSYELSMTNNGTAIPPITIPASFPVKFTSSIGWTTLAGGQRAGYDVGYSDPSLQIPGRGTILNGQFETGLSNGTLVQLYVQHDSSVTEMVVGSSTTAGPVSNWHSYMQIVRVA